MHGIGLPTVDCHDGRGGAGHAPLVHLLIARGGRTGRHPQTQLLDNKLTIDRFETKFGMLDFWIVQAMPHSVPHGISMGLYL